MNLSSDNEKRFKSKRQRQTVKPQKLLGIITLLEIIAYISQIGFSVPRITVVFVTRF